ncbi:MAG: SseB family protein [Actinomycetota bacterium]|nr:SseB family protein [Actinomycetota bacterium]
MSDAGLADERLAAALTSGSHAEVLAAVAGARVFAAISATSTAEEVTAHGLRAESSAEMAVLLVEADGRRALPVFSSVGELKQWRREARPVPLLGSQACQAALDERAEEVLLDPAGAAIALSWSEVRSLAQGWVPIAGSGLASRHAETELQPPATPVPQQLIDALARALTGEQLRSARLLQGPEGLVLGVAPRRPLDPPPLATLAHRVMERLGPDLPTGGLDLAQVVSRGPGVPIPVSPRPDGSRLAALLRRPPRP